MESILRLESVSLIYHSPDGETLAIQDLDLDVQEGEFLALVGPSGCGKSTLLSMAAGLIRPTSGKVYLYGEEVTGVSPRVGYMLQRDHLFEWRTIWQNVTLGLQVRRQAVPEKVTELLKTYGLYEFRNSKPSELSGGMRQRAALIRTLAIDPDVLLLDEPFSALDYQTRLELGDDMSRIIRNEKKTALFVTHDIAEAVSIADRVIVLSGRPARIKKSVPIDLCDCTPLQRRSQPEFHSYFDAIWKEFEGHGDPQKT